MIWTDWATLALGLLVAVPTVLGWYRRAPHAPSRRLAALLLAPLGVWCLLVMLWDRHGPLALVLLLAGGLMAWLRSPARPPAP